jgi:hypothetical protein
VEGLHAHTDATRSADLDKVQHVRAFAVAHCSTSEVVTLKEVLLMEMQIQYLVAILLKLATGAGTCSWSSSKWQPSTPLNARGTAVSHLYMCPSLIIFQRMFLLRPEPLALSPSALTPKLRGSPRWR